MSDEQDGFMSNAFGLDLGQLAQNAKEEISAGLGQAANTVSQAVQGVQGALEGAIGEVTGVVSGAVKKVAGAVSGSPSGGASGGGTGSFPLGGSVGRGGRNAPNDVRAVQAALGISADGKCGEGTIAAIVAFQRNMGQAKPDGRVDAGGGTERALAGGARPVVASGEPSSTQGGDGSSGILGQAEALFDDAKSGLQTTLQSAQSSLLTDLGASPETVQGIEVAEQAIADFDKGRQAGRAKGSIGLLEMLPPVQLFKAVSRIAAADDGEAEALKIADEKRATLAAIGEFGVDPAGSGAAIGEGLGKDAVKARQEGRLAEFAGNLAGQGDVIAATVAVGGAGAGLEAGGARGVAAGAESAGARGVAAGAESAGARGAAAGAESAGARGAAAAESGAARTLRGLGDPPTFREPPTLRGLGDPPTVRDPATLRGLGDPPTVRDPATLRGLGEPPTVRDPATLRGVGEPVRPIEPGDPFGEGPPTKVDPAKPQPELKRPKANFAETPAQAEVNLLDARAELRLAQQNSADATGELVRLRASRAVNPVLDKQLEDQVLRTLAEQDEAILKVRAAEKAAEAAASRAKGSRGRSGFPPKR